MSRGRGTRQRAILYLRQSTFREESISLELQESAGREHAARHGYEVVGVESDPGLSGRTFNRPGVAAVMDAVQRGAADVIVLWKWSRLSRNRLDWYLAADRTQEAGGRIESATEPIDTSTSIGRLSRGMMIEIAAYESERAGDQWREAQARRVKLGLTPHGKATFGYFYDRENGIHVPDPVTGPILVDLYRRFAAGETMYGLCIWLNSQGITTLHGKRWTAGNLIQILDKEFAVGRIFYHGQWLPGAHEPLITEAEFAAYRQARKRRSAAPRTEASEYLLSGLTKCGVCGRALTGAAARGRWWYYRCYSARFSGAHQGVQIPTHLVDDTVRAWVEQEAKFRRSVPVETAPKPTADVAALKRTVTQHETSLSRLTVQLAENIISPDAYRLAAAPLEEKLGAARNALEAGTAEEAAPPLRDALVSLADDWDILPVTHRRTLLHRALDAVTIDFNADKHIEIYPAGTYTPSTG